MNTSMKLPIGAKIKTTDGQEITVLKELAHGGAGNVYKVQYCGEIKALKWYTIPFYDNKVIFKSILANDILKGNSTEWFIWPLAMTEEVNGAFGYVMDLLPDGYYDINKCLHSRGKEGKSFKNFQSVANACINIIYSFMILHSKGYVFYNFDGDEFVINPDTGDVKLIYKGNMVSEGVTPIILRNVDYMAPEINRGESTQNIHTDYHLLAVLLFKLCVSYGSHPLLGKCSMAMPPTLSREEICDILLAYEPLFIFDPKDDRNGPITGVHDVCVSIWNALPQYMKDTFIKAFSQEALMDPYKRVSEREWLDVFSRFRSGIGTCSCGNDVIFRRY